MRWKQAWDIFWKQAKPTLQEQYEADTIAELTHEREKGERYLYDFQKGVSGFADIGTPFDVGQAGKNKERTTKIAVKPIDVLKELQTTPTPFSLAGLDEKIALLNDKIAVSENPRAKSEMQGMIARLENRRHYLDNKIFFDNYQNTTQSAIDALLEKYDLVMKESDLFVPEFPKDAIDAIKKYTGVVNRVTGKKPKFYVIATSDNFKSLDRKRDPILLAQSPFGFFWQILGAWDKEMQLLSEL